MKPVKLYYDAFPGKKLCYDFIKHNIRSYSEWQTGRYQFHDILNELSIPWEWTDDPKQGIVVTEIESTAPENIPLFLDYFDQKFDKYIVLSMTEPRYTFVSDKQHDVFKRYPNAFFMDVSSATTCDFSLNQKKYLQFPFFIFRCTSSTINGMLCHGEHQMEKPESKLYDFNHLSYNCRFEKFVSHYHLHEKYKLTNCLFTYRPQLGTANESIRDAIMFHGEKYNIDPATIHDMIRKLDDEPFEELTLPEDTMFNSNLRQHPVELYEDTCISLITESYHHDDVFFITEKTIQPIMNSHPFIVNGSTGFNQFLSDQGFALYDELFDYSFDSMPSMVNRADFIAKQAANFDRSVLIDNITTVVHKVQHNKNLLTNRNSVVFLKYRELMLEYIDRYYST